jgi:hypothetical protein
MLSLGVGLDLMLVKQSSVALTAAIWVRELPQYMKRR